MKGKEFLELSDKFHAAIRRGMQQCTEMQTGLSDDIKTGRISRDESESKIREIEERLKFYGEQLDIYDRLIKGLMKES